MLSVIIMETQLQNAIDLDVLIDTCMWLFIIKREN